MGCSSEDHTPASIDSGAGSDLLNKNLLTTAGVLIGSGTAVAGTVILTAALPGQVIAAAALTGGLIYAGDRQDKGLPITPWGKVDVKLEAQPDVKSEEPVVATT